MKRLLSIDYGEVRVGIALSDLLHLTVRPYKTIKNDQNLIQEIQSIVVNENIERIILGIPLNLKGEETKKTLEVKSFHKLLTSEIHVPVDLFNETYSTNDAKEFLKDKRISLKSEKKIIDQIAACVILKDYLESAR